VREKLRKSFAELKPAWAQRLGPDHMLQLPELGHLSETALTRDAEIVLSDKGLPSTFVPGRNLLFFTYAAALAYRRGVRNLVGGMCETDFSGYPDCRNDTLQSLGKAISLGMDAEFIIETPLMWIDKAGTWALTEALGGAPLVELITEESHTCYLGVRSRRHAWGYGCNHCPACALRRQGWEKWQAGKTT
jgi:7-cyano-7-deazaguanine synthase